MNGTTGNMVGYREEVHPGRRYRACFCKVAEGQTEFKCRVVLDR